MTDKEIKALEYLKKILKSRDFRTDGDLSEVITRAGDILLEDGEILEGQANLIKQQKGKLNGTA